MHYDLKKTWKELLLSIPILITLVISILFIFHEGFKTTNFYIYFCLYYLFGLWVAKDSILSRNFILLNENDRSFSDRARRKKFYILTGENIFKEIKPILKYSILRKILGIITIISFVPSTILYFIVIMNNNEYNNILYVIFAIIMSILISVFLINYFIIRPILFFYYIFLKSYTYKLKRNIYEDHTLYINTENYLFIYKNNKLHSNRSPASIHLNLFLNFNFSDFLPENSSKEQIENIMDSLTIKGDWYLNGNKIEGIDNNSSNENIRKKIKTMNIANNF